MRGIKRLIDGGGDASTVASVASFFVSRVDTEADRRLDEVGGPDELKGKLAIANAKLAYVTYQELFSGPDWTSSPPAGATPQRCLWASTSTKNPDVPRRDVRRGADRARHGEHDAARDGRGVQRPRPRRSGRSTATSRGARSVLEAFAAAGIDYDDVVETLEREGVEKFAKSFRELFADLEAKRDQLVAA